MYDSSPNRPFTPSERWIVVIFALVIFGLLIAEVLTNYDPAKLSILLVVVFWIPLLALHEAGHALAAAVLGWYVGQVVIGMGRTLARFRVGSAVVDIRLFPIQGYVTCVPRNLVLPRLKSALIYFAGPGIELLLAAILVGLVGPERMFSRADGYGIIAVQSLALAAVIQGVLNLVPQFITTPQGGNIVNDGLGIIRSFLVPHSYYAAMIGATFNQEAEDWEGLDAADEWKDSRPGRGR